LESLIVTGEMREKIVGVIMPIPPRRVEPCSNERGKCWFSPRAEHCMVDIVDSRGYISWSLKYVLTNGYVTDGSMIACNANHLIFWDKEEL